MSAVEATNRKVVLIGVGGATCSGKTTLAKHLRNLLPGSTVIHQDDFAPPQEKVPYHPKYNVQDWDDAPGAIDWLRLSDVLEEMKHTGVVPDYYSHDHLNEQKQVHLNTETSERWKAKFASIAEKHLIQGDRIIWILLDGFLLYWHPRVVAAIDVSLFLRVPHDVLRARRHERAGYHTAVQSDPEGTMWKDPPEYWEQIVYPAYVRAHTDIFERGNVESGLPSTNMKKLVVIEGMSMDIDSVVERACEAIVHFTES